MATVINLRMCRFLKPAVFSKLARLTTNKEHFVSVSRYWLILLETNNACSRVVVAPGRMVTGSLFRR